MQQYSVTLNGESPLLMHQDNLAFSEKVKKWCKDPANKGSSIAGDDRTPPWTWIGYLYHNGDCVGMPSDNLMTMLREGGSQVVKKAPKTYKKDTQSGILIDQQQFDLLIDDQIVSINPIKNLIGDNDFNNHIETVENLGFELLVKRAKINKSKHIRVRPLFRKWKLVGSLTVLDEELSGLTQDVLDIIFTQAGALCGLGDWRPSSGSSGTFGRFSHVIKPI